jgi:hypothetical protein
MAIDDEPDRNCINTSVVFSPRIPHNTKKREDMQYMQYWRCRTLFWILDRVPYCEDLTV